MCRCPHAARASHALSGIMACQHSFCSPAAIVLRCRAEQALKRAHQVDMECFKGAAADDEHAIDGPVHWAAK